MKKYKVKISIIVPMYNAARTIENCIKSLLNQTYKNYELIVVDDCSEDNSVAIVKKYPVKLICNKRNSGPGVSRNIGIKKSKGDIIAFTDSDCVVKKNWLELICETFKKYPYAGAVGGSVINANETLIGYADYFLNYSEHIQKGKIHKRRTIPTMNIAYKKKLIKGLEYPSIRNSEDTIFDYNFQKAGNVILFNPAIAVSHFSDVKSFDSFLKKQKSYGEGFAYSRVKHDLPGKILIKYPILLVLMPRLMIITKRMVSSRYFLRYIAAFPYVFIGELEFIKAITKFKKK